MIAGHVAAKDMKSGEVMTLQSSRLTAVVACSDVQNYLVTPFIAVAAAGAVTKRDSQCGVRTVFVLPDLPTNPADVTTGISGMVRIA